MQNGAQAPPAIRIWLPGLARARQFAEAFLAGTQARVTVGVVDTRLRLARLPDSPHAQLVRRPF